MIRLLPIALTIVWAVPASAAPPHQVLPEGAKPSDSRLEAPKDLNGHFPFEVPERIEQWESRAAELRQQVLVANGLWPLPEKTPLDAVIHGKVVRDGFSVEKVYFQSVPNHYVTGLLFRPEKEAPAAGYPAVLCPHGHGGRLQDLGVDGVRQEIAQGFERFESSGRFPAMARCAQLARMGCVTFIFDMIGYGDSNQIPFEVAHRAAKKRPEMEGTDRWGFYSVSAELRLQSIMGLQTWNAIRSLDFLCQLPDVDANRVAVTGNSGGGTQTILLGAIDQRPVAFFPNGMVSTSMQGGCYCENCSVLRVGTGNVELTALFAPRPAGMTAVDDWTRDMMTDGYPQLQKLYAMYGKPENVLCKSYPHFPHNYNYVTRGLMYQFFNRHLGLGLAEPIIEQDYRFLSPEEYTVWNEQHPAPRGGPEYEKDLLVEMAAASEAQMARMQKQDPDQHAAVVRTAYETIIGRTLPAEGSVQLVDEKTGESNGNVITKGLIAWADSGERVPAVMIRKEGRAEPREVVVVLRGTEKKNLWNEAGELKPEVQQRIDAGQVVVGIDLFAAGENRTEAFGEFAQRWVDDDRHYAAFNYGYNPTTFARRVHDVLSTLALVRDRFQSADISLVASDAAAPVASMAQYLADETVADSDIEPEPFDYAGLDSFRNANFLPGALKYGPPPAKK
jgi:dienelactone hydrolase